MECGYYFVNNNKIDIKENLKIFRIIKFFKLLKKDKKILETKFKTKK